MLKNTVNLLEALISSHQEQFHSPPDYILFGKAAIFSFLEELHRRDKNHWLEKGFRYKNTQIILVDAQLQVRNWQYVGYDYFLQETSNKGLIYSNELIATASSNDTETNTNHFCGLVMQGGAITTFFNAVTKNQFYSKVFSKIIAK